MRNLASPIVAILAAGASGQVLAHAPAVGETLAQTMSHQLFSLHHVPAILLIGGVLYFLAVMRQHRGAERRRDR